MAKKPPIVVEDFRPTEISAFRRIQWFETAKTIIQIALMSGLALALFVFVVLLILAGVTVGVLPQTEGVSALSNLFQEVAVNAKAVALFALGFFFREYLSAKSVNSK